MPPYLIVVEEAGAGFSAYAPDLPGCVATGATVEEAAERMQEAVLAHLAGLREDGEPVPPARASARYVADPRPEDKPSRCGCVPLNLYLDPSLQIQRLSNQKFQDLLCYHAARGDLVECWRLKAIRARCPVGVKVRHLLESLCGGG